VVYPPVVYPAPYYAPRVVVGAGWRVY